MSQLSPTSSLSPVSQTMPELKQKLLLVDDHQENLTVLKAVLKNQGYDLVTALNGKEALHQVTLFDFDLILLDIMMPELDGYEVCQILKADPDTVGVPIIFITAKTDFESVVKGYELGAVDYVTKPFNPAILRVRIKNHLRLRQAELDLKRSVASLEQEMAHRVEVERMLRLREKELERFALLDGLTQIANRRRFDEYLQFQWANKKRSKKPISLVLCDIDFFKQFNDHYGHQAGDQALQNVARALQRTLKRPEDIACRYGGEEFVLVLPDTPTEGAVTIAHRLQEFIQDLQIPHEFSRANPLLTLSMGVSTLTPANDCSMEELIQRADQCLYAAKRQGRNRVVAVLAEDETENATPNT